MRPIRRSKYFELFGRQLGAQHRDGVLELGGGAGAPGHLVGQLFLEGEGVALCLIRLAAGAEFVVMICGEIMTMPGLPKAPAADSIDIDETGKVVGLF